MVRTEEILAEHIKGISADLDTVFLQMFAKEILHYPASSAASRGIVVVERLRMCRFQYVVELGPVRIGQADQITHGVHSRRAGEVLVGAALTEMLLLCSSLLPGNAAVSCVREMHCPLSLLAYLAQHNANANDEHEPREAAATGSLMLHDRNGCLPLAQRSG